MHVSFSAPRRAQVHDPRDSDEGRLLQRLEAVLQRFPLVVKPTDETPSCPKHGVMMKLNHGKDGSTWHSHKTADGWCKGR